MVITVIACWYIEFVFEECYVNDDIVIVIVIIIM